MILGDLFRHVNLNITTMKHHLKIIIIVFLTICLISILQTCKKITEPDVTTDNVSAVTATTATSGGNVTSNGGAEVTARGVCWGTTEKPTGNKTSDGSGNGHFPSNITGLTANTIYYVRAYSTNSVGTSYGNEVSFSTNGNPPVAAFTASTTTITAGQSVQFTDQSTNNPTSWNWNFGDGSASSTTQSPSHTYSIAGTYTVTLTATNSTGSDTETKTNYIKVNATGVAPVAAFTSSSTTIMAGQSVQFTDQSTNSPTSWSWNFGDGSASSTTQSPSHTYSTIGSYTVILTVSNSYGSDGETKVSFITVLPLRITDVDNNTYGTVTIGSQVWMAENLKTTKYNDGISTIPLVTDESNWASLRTHAYCWYNNNVSNKNTYGTLYNWYTVNSGKLCPSGWHVPTDNEWTILINSLGGLSIAGGKLKESGTVHWVSPNVATNTSNFTCLPGGIRHSNGIFEFIGTGTQLWSSTESDAANAWSYGLDNIYESIYRESNLKYMGQSVRCVKD